MSLQPAEQDDFKHELEATLAARNELGPEYDSQFIDRLSARLVEQVRAEIAKAPKPRSSGFSPEQRLPIAICSLIFGIPLVAIAATVGIGGIIIAFAALVLINVAAGISW